MKKTFVIAGLFIIINYFSFSSENLDENSVVSDKGSTSYKKMKAGYLVEKDFSQDLVSNTVSFSYDELKKYKILLSHEFAEVNNGDLRVLNYMELYKGPLYFYIAKGDIVDYSVGVDYTFKNNITTGIKQTKYSDGVNVEILKLIHDFYTSSSIITNQANFIFSDKNSYYLSSSLAAYGAKYTIYYDLTTLNSGNIKYKKEFDSIDLEGGMTYDFHKKSVSLSINTSVKF